MNTMSTIIYLCYVGAVLGWLLIYLVNEEKISRLRKIFFCLLILNTTVLHATLLNMAQTPTPLIHIFYFDLKLWILMLGLVFVLISIIFFISEKNERFKRLIGLEE